MAKHHEVEYLILNNAISFEFIEECYGIVDGYDIAECFLIYEIFKGTFSEELKKTNKNSSIKNFDDIYSLGDPEKVLIKNFIKLKLYNCIEILLLPLLNFNFSLREKPTIPDCFIIILEDKLLIGTTKSSVFSSSWREENSFINIILLKRFIFNKIGEEDGRETPAL